MWIRDTDKTRVYIIYFFKGKKTLSNLYISGSIIRSEILSQPLFYIKVSTACSSWVACSACFYGQAVSLSLDIQFITFLCCLSVTVVRESTTVYLGSDIMLIYFVMWRFCFNISNHFLFVLRWFCFAWLFFFFFGVCPFVLWCISVLNQYNRSSCSIAHSSDIFPG